VSEWINSTADGLTTETATTTSVDMLEWLTGLQNVTTESSDTVLVSEVNRTNYTALIGEFYDDFEYVSETYLMTTLAVVGIVLNTLAMIATCGDGHMRRMSRSLHCIFFAAENLFLGGFVGFLQLRGHERRLHRDKEYDLEVRRHVFIKSFTLITSDCTV